MGKVSSLTLMRALRAVCVDDHLAIALMGHFRLGLEHRGTPYGLGQSGRMSPLLCLTRA